MKGAWWTDMRSLLQLYIPHGSDERLYTYVCHDLPPFFISHMVQMKDFTFNFLVFIRTSLYPTWFRWKKVKSQNQKLKTDFISHMVQMKVFPYDLLWKSVFIFISHMVQMKDFIRLLDEDFDSALYPTWFRWKLPLWPALKVCIYLYIPHGSDESDTASFIFDLNIRLYIPHGSDESQIQITICQ